MRSKKNKKKLIIAIFLGVIATFSLFNSMNSQKAVINELNQKLKQQNNSLAELKKNPFNKDERKEEGIKAVIAASDIKVGDTIELGMIEVKNFAKDELPPNYFKTDAMVAGKEAGKNISKGAFLTSADIRVIDVNSIDIPNDSRAVTIPVNKFKGLASHIKVGSRVDILKVSTPPEFIAQNIKIISFESGNSQPARRNPNDADTGKMTAKMASAITFLIPIDIVSNVIDAMIRGNLQIITRNNTDDRLLLSESPETIAPLPEPPPIPPSEQANLPGPAMPEPDPQQVEIIKASSVTTMEIKPEPIQLSNEKNDDLSDEKLRELLDMVN